MVCFLYTAPQKEDRAKSHIEILVPSVLFLVLVDQRLGQELMRSIEEIRRSPVWIIETLDDTEAQDIK